MGSNGSQANNSGSGLYGSVPDMPVGQRPGKKRGNSSQTSDSQPNGDEGEAEATTIPTVTVAEVPGGIEFSTGW